MGTMGTASLTIVDILHKIVMLENVPRAGMSGTHMNDQSAFNVQTYKHLFSFFIPVIFSILFSCSFHSTFVLLK